MYIPDFIRVYVLDFRVYALDDDRNVPVSNFVLNFKIFFIERYKFTKFQYG